MSASILFLDLASTTGWAEGAPGARAKSGTIRLSRDGGGPETVAGNFIDFLGLRLGAFDSRPARVVYEAPFLGSVKNANTVMITYGLAFTTMGICQRFGIPCFSANLSKIRPTILGYRPDPKTAKRVVIDYVSSLGYEPADDNEADALVGWLYACKTVAPQVAPAHEKTLFS